MARMSMSCMSAPAWHNCACGRRDAWHGLGDMPASDAMQQYVTHLSGVAPSWVSSMQGEGQQGEGEDEDMGPGTSHAKRAGGGGFGPVFSTFAEEEGAPDGHTSEQVGMPIRMVLCMQVVAVHACCVGACCVGGTRGYWACLRHVVRDCMACVRSQGVVVHAMQSAVVVVLACRKVGGSVYTS